MSQVFNREGIKKMVGLGSKGCYRPRMVLGYIDSAHAAQCGRFFRRQGWEVHLVASAAEVHQLVRELTPEVVVVDLDLPDESGWLICAKSLLDNQDQQFVLMGQGVTEHKRQRAAYLGVTALVDRAEGPEALVDEIQANVAQAV